MALLGLACPISFPKVFLGGGHVETTTRRGGVALTSSRKLLGLKNPKNHHSSFTVKCMAAADGSVSPSPIVPELKREDFPADFKFGCCTSAFQTEGSGTEGGRGPAVWDHFIQDSSTPGTDIAVNSYNLYKDDVQLLKNMNVDVYRFSISWSRLLPKGTISEGINQEGIDFYNNFINELIDNGVTPCVTLFHFDLPTALQTKYNGFLSDQIVEDFKSYADLCFKTFGDRVKIWTTINEPQVWGSYATSPSSPANSFIASHHIILAHATVARLYKDTYQSEQGGEIGMTIGMQWFKPYSETREDKAAAHRCFDFFAGWFLDPLIFGDYPFSMKSLVRELLPPFTDEQKALVKGAYDFIGVNYYTSRFAKAVPFDYNANITTLEGYQFATTSVERDGEYIGVKSSGSDEIYVVPEGLRHVLNILKTDYTNPRAIVTENGYPSERDDSLSMEEQLADPYRIKHMVDHLNAIKEARSEGANVNGYWMWALMDCLEMGSGYTSRFGLNYTDYLNDLKRTPKQSAEWLKSFLKNEQKLSAF